MKKHSLCAFLLAISALAANASAESFDCRPVALAQLPVDKAAHFGLSGMATIFAMRVGQVVTGDREISLGNRIVSSLLVFAIGVGKEVEDRKKYDDHVLDVGDLDADAAGILTANILMIKF